jgi:hypothetical protein
MTVSRLQSGRIEIVDKVMIYDPAGCMADGWPCVRDTVISWGGMEIVIGGSDDA